MSNQSNCVYYSGFCCGEVCAYVCDQIYCLCTCNGGCFLCLFDCFSGFFAGVVDEETRVSKDANEVTDTKDVL